MFKICCAIYWHSVNNISSIKLIHKLWGYKFKLVSSSKNVWKLWKRKWEKEQQRHQFLRFRVRSFRFSFWKCNFFGFSVHTSFRFHMKSTEKWPKLNRIYIFLPKWMARRKWKSKSTDSAKNKYIFYYIKYNYLCSNSFFDENQRMEDAWIKLRLGCYVFVSIRFIQYIGWFPVECIMCTEANDIALFDLVIIWCVLVSNAFARFCVQCTMYKCSLYT